MDEFLRQLAASGPLGLIAAIALWVAWQKDKQVAALHEKLLSTYQANIERYHTTAVQLNSTISSLSKTVGALEASFEIVEEVAQNARSDAEPDRPRLPSGTRGASGRRRRGSVAGGDADEGPEE